MKTSAGENNADPRRYRIELPNLIDDMGLAPFAFRLYVHYKRVCGADGGVCWKSTQTTAKHCRMAVGSVSKAKRELVARGLVRIVRRRGDKTDHVTIVNLWARNLAHFAAKRSRDEGSRSQDERSRSGDETSHSPRESKKEPPEEGPKEEATIEEIITPVVPLKGDLAYWIEICFRCFKTKPRRLPKRLLRELEEQLPDLEPDKNLGERLVSFYHSFRSSHFPPFSCRKHTVHSLIRNLVSQMDVIRNERFI